MSSGPRPSIIQKMFGYLNEVQTIFAGGPNIKELTEEDIKELNAIFEERLKDFGKECFQIAQRGYLYVSMELPNHIRYINVDMDKDSRFSH